MCGREISGVSKKDRARALFRRAVDSRYASIVLLIAFFWIVAAASFSGFLGKRGLHGASQRGGIEAMLDGSAHRPFVFRRLAPMIATFAVRHTPPAVKEFVATEARYNRVLGHVVPRRDQDLAFGCVVICYLVFTALFISLFVLRALVLAAGAGEGAAVMAPAAFILAFPYLEVGGGYFYDSIELLFLSTAVLMAMGGRLGSLLLLVVPAVLNKETFIFFLPTLYPFLRRRFALKQMLVAGAVLLFAGGLTYFKVRSSFAGAPGVPAEFHLWENVRSYLYLPAYLQMGATYGIVGPDGNFVLSLIIVAIVCARGWLALPEDLRNHVKLACAINVPLYLVLGVTGELRGLSLLYCGFVILMAFAIRQTGRLNSTPGASMKQAS